MCIWNVAKLPAKLSLVSVLTSCLSAGSQPWCALPLSGGGICACTHLISQGKFPEATGGVLNGATWPLSRFRALILRHRIFFFLNPKYKVELHCQNCAGPACCAQAAAALRSVPSAPDPSTRPCNRSSAPLQRTRRPLAHVTKTPI